MWNIYGRVRRFPFNHDSKRIVFINAALPGAFTEGANTIGGLVHFPSGWHCFLHFVFNTDAHTHTLQICLLFLHTDLAMRACMHVCMFGVKRLTVLADRTCWAKYGNSAHSARLSAFGQFCLTTGCRKHSVYGSAYIFKALTSRIC